MIIHRGDRMIWILIMIVIMTNLIHAGCGLSKTTPEPNHCYKVWDKSLGAAVWECEKVSQSTRDGAR